MKNKMNALLLAKWLDVCENELMNDSANELRRLHELNEIFKTALQRISEKKFENFYKAADLLRETIAIAKDALDKDFE